MNRGTPPTPTLAPFLYDLQNCDLAQVTWVVPDGRWSDHATESLGLGPDYVADIVNAVGGTGPPVNTCGFWSNTVILIVCVMGVRLEWKHCRVALHQVT